jgi:hypothetical protein
LNSVNCSDEKRQPTRRLPRQFVLRTLHEFNSGRIGVPEACQRLHAGKPRLYGLKRGRSSVEAYIKTIGPLSFSHLLKSHAPIAAFVAHDSVKSSSTMVPSTNGG